MFAYVEGLDELAGISELKRAMETAAYRTLNRAAERGRTAAADQIRSEIAFPASYLQPATGRLTVSKKAGKGSLESRIRARGRATSLSRFVTSGGGRGEGVNLQVKQGLATYMGRAFLIKLNAGSGQTENKFNQGLAIRLRPGETIRNKTNAIRMARGLYLLYGPSVQQAFLNEAGKGVAIDISPSIAEFMEREYMRQVNRDGW